MALSVRLPVYLSIGGGEGVEVGKLEITADASSQFTLTADGIADMLRAAADAYDIQPEQDDAEGVPDAAAQQ